LKVDTAVMQKRAAYYLAAGTQPGHASVPLALEPARRRRAQVKYREIEPTELSYDGLSIFHQN